MDRQRRVRLLAAAGAVLAVVIAVGAWVAIDRTAPQDGRAAGGGASSAANPAPLRRLDPAAFAARLADPAATVINVHTPYAGELANTDAFIPYDSIAGDRRLPRDKATEILVYCRSGRMSQIAADILVAAGYTNVVDLRGGMDAWAASGRTVLQRPR